MLTGAAMKGINHRPALTCSIGSSWASAQFSLQHLPETCRGWLLSTPVHGFSCELVELIRGISQVMQARRLTEPVFLGSFKRATQKMPWLKSFTPVTAQPTSSFTLIRLCSRDPSHIHPFSTDPRDVRVLCSQHITFVAFFVRYRLMHIT